MAEAGFLRDKRRFHRCCPAFFIILLGVEFSRNREKNENFFDDGSRGFEQVLLGCDRWWAFVRVECRNLPLRRYDSRPVELIWKLVAQYFKLRCSLFLWWLSSRSIYWHRDLGFPQLLSWLIFAVSSQVHFQWTCFVFTIRVYVLLYARILAHPRYTDGVAAASCMCCKVDIGLRAYCLCAKTSSKTSAYEWFLLFPVFLGFVLFAKSI